MLDPFIMLCFQCFVTLVFAEFFILTVSIDFPEFKSHIDVPH